MAFKRVDGLRTIEFGRPGESRKKLIDLILFGNKRATAGLASEYSHEKEEIEHVGEVLIILDNDDGTAGKIKVTKVNKCKFKEVPDEFALAEAEGDLNASDFRNSHREYWAEEGNEITDETEVVLIYFELISN